MGLTSLNFHELLSTTTASLIPCIVPLVHAVLSVIREKHGNSPRRPLYHSIPSCFINLMYPRSELLPRQQAFSHTPCCSGVPVTHHISLLSTCFCKGNYKLTRSKFLSMYAAPQPQRNLRKCVVLCRLSQLLVVNASWHWSHLWY